MPLVWQDFVLAWVRMRHGGQEVHAQYAFPLFNNRATPTVAADVIVFSSPKVLYDAKYKPVGATLSADDVYQMVTYCERLGLPEATLVYPGTGNTTTACIGDRRI